MTLTNFMTGLALLAPYTETQFPLGAEHDIVYFYPTERPLPPEVVAVLRSLGWFQPDVDDLYDRPGPYSPNEGWAAYV